MKRMMLLFPLLLLIIGCPYGAVAPLSFKYEFDKTEFKGGDVVTITADLPIFQSNNKEVKMGFPHIMYRNSWLFGARFVQPKLVINDYKAEFVVPHNIWATNDTRPFTNYFQVNHYVTENNNYELADGFCSQDFNIIDYEKTLSLSSHKIKIGDELTITSSKPIFNENDFYSIAILHLLEKQEFVLICFNLNETSKSVNNVFIKESQLKIISANSLSFIISENDGYNIDDYGDGTKFEAYISVMNFNSIQLLSDSTFPFKTDPENNVAFYRSAEMLTIEK